MQSKYNGFIKLAKGADDLSSENLRFGFMPLVSHENIS